MEKQLLEENDCYKNRRDEVEKQLNEIKLKQG